MGGRGQWLEGQPGDTVLIQVSEKVKLEQGVGNRSREWMAKIEFPMYFPYLPLSFLHSAKYFVPSKSQVLFFSYITSLGLNSREGKKTQNMICM